MYQLNCLLPCFSKACNARLISMTRTPHRKPTRRRTALSWQPVFKTNVQQSLKNCRPGVLAPLEGAKQHLRGCEMIIQVFVLHCCTVMLSSFCASCSAQSVSNYSMTSARPSIRPEMMLISKKSQHVQFQP